MKNHKEKMVIVKINPNDGTACPLLDISNEMAPVCALDNRVPYCKECRKGFTRAEAIERMAKGLYEYQYPKMRPYWDDDENGHKEFYLKRAEAALNALLGKEAENGNN